MHSRSRLWQLTDRALKVKHPCYRLNPAVGWTWTGRRCRCWRKFRLSARYSDIISTASHTSSMAHQSPAIWRHSLPIALAPPRPVFCFVSCTSSVLCRGKWAAMLQMERICPRILFALLLSFSRSLFSDLVCLQFNVDACIIAHI